MDRFKKWAGREYGERTRLVAIIFGGILFWVIIPACIILGAHSLDRWLGLPRLVYDSVNVLVGSIFIITGWLFANWTVKVQYSLGRGTPIPLMATQKLVIEGPYQYCRNPMTLGTTVFYLGVAIWLGSLSGLGLAMIYPVGIMFYIKVFEEKELETRFGSEYLEYKRKTPSLKPRLRRGK